MANEINVKEFNNSQDYIVVHDQNNDGLVGPEDLAIVTDGKCFQDRGTVLKFDDPVFVKYRQGYLSNKVLKEAQTTAIKDRNAAISAIYGITIGEPHVIARCECESLGIYDRNGTRLFDVWSNGARFSPDDLSKAVADGLGVEPKACPGMMLKTDCAGMMISISPGAEDVLSRHDYTLKGNRLIPSFEQISSTPERADINLGTVPEAGIIPTNDAVFVAALNENVLKLILWKNDGKREFAYVDLRNGNVTSFFDETSCN